MAWNDMPYKNLRHPDPGGILRGATISEMRNVPETESGCCGRETAGCLGVCLPCSVEFGGAFHGFVTLQMLTCAPHPSPTQPFDRKTILHWRAGAVPSG